MRRIHSKKDKIGTYEIDKISLLYFDDKRFVLDDRIHTLAYFHKDKFLQKKKTIKKNKKEPPQNKMRFSWKKEILKDKKDFHKKKRFSQTKNIPKEFLWKTRDSHRQKKFSEKEKILTDKKDSKRFS